VIECLPCPVGKYNGNASDRLGACQKCQPGRFAQKKGATACQDCPLGRFGEHSGATAACDCQVCPLGRFGSIRGARRCAKCVPGHFRNESMTSCEKCGPGRYAQQGATACQACPRGRFMAAEGASNCTLCAAGTYGPKEGALQSDACLDCTADSISRAGQGDCKPCGPGREPRANHKECWIPDRGAFLLSQRVWQGLVGAGLVGLGIARWKCGAPERKPIQGKASRCLQYWFPRCGRMTYWPLHLLVIWHLIDWVLFLAWFLKAKPEKRDATDQFERDFIIATLGCGAIYCGPMLLLLSGVLPRWWYVRIEALCNCLECFLVFYADKVYGFKSRSPWLTVLKHFSTAVDIVAFQGPSALDTMCVVCLEEEEEQQQAFVGPEPLNRMCDVDLEEEKQQQRQKEQERLRVGTTGVVSELPRYGGHTWERVGLATM